MTLETEVEEMVTIPCLFDHTPINIPKDILDNRGEIKKEYYGITLPSGVYISPSTGSPYCRRECLIKYCED